MGSDLPQFSPSSINLTLGGKSLTLQQSSQQQERTQNKAAGLNTTTKYDWPPLCGDKATNSWSEGKPHESSDRKNQGFFAVKMCCPLGTFVFTSHVLRHSDRSDGDRQ